MWILEVLVMDASYPSGAPYVLSYHSWVLRAEEVMVRDLLTHSPGMHRYYPAPSGSIADASELLLDALAPACLFNGPADPVENPMIPRHIAEVYAETQSALLLIEHLFTALFDAEAGATVYAGATEYDGEDSPNLLAPFSVVVLSGAVGYRLRRVLYEGESLLEDLVCASPEELYNVHGKLHTKVDGYLSCGDGYERS